jgi:hypothetical protein
MPEAPRVGVRVRFVGLYRIAIGHDLLTVFPKGMTSALAGMTPLRATPSVTSLSTYENDGYARADRNPSGLKILPWIRDIEWHENEVNEMWTLYEFRWRDV